MLVREAKACLTAVCFDVVVKENSYGFRICGLHARGFFRVVCR